MQTILVVFHLFLALGLIGLVLIQHGKGADAGAAFGSGASATVFGARGSASFLTRATGVLATLFFISSMAMAYFANESGKQPGLMDDVTEAPETSIVAPAKEVPEVPQSAVPQTPVSDLPKVPPAAVKPVEPAASDVPAVVPTEPKE